MMIWIVMLTSLQVFAHLRPFLSSPELHHGWVAWVTRHNSMLMHAIWKLEIFSYYGWLNSLAGENQFLSSMFFHVPFAAFSKMWSTLILSWRTTGLSVSITDASLAALHVHYPDTWGLHFFCYFGDQNIDANWSCGRTKLASQLKHHQSFHEPKLEGSGLKLSRKIYRHNLDLKCQDKCMGQESLDIG